MGALLDVDLRVDYPKKARALEGVRFTVGARESVAVLGESGSGKSTLVLAILGLLDVTGARVSGRILFDGVDLLTLSERRWRKIRGKEIAFVPQSALAALNPAMRIGGQMEEAWRVHSREKRAWKERAFELFRRVSLPADDDFLRRFPAQISVGQAQRVLIAMALLHRPRLLISDEPTSAVDPATRDEIRSLLRDLSGEYSISNLLITHDVSTIIGLCSRAVVLREGRLLRELGAAELEPLRRAAKQAQALSGIYAEATHADGGLLNLAAAVESASAVHQESAAVEWKP